MKTYNWTQIDLFCKSDYFKQGTGISVGCFDGIHLGHQFLLETLINNCKRQNLFSGVITFSRPLQALKKSENYDGDITSLDMRLKILEAKGVDFVFIVDFNEKFASKTGEEFLLELIQKCNMKYIAEGVDFRCGYKGLCNTDSIKLFADKYSIQTDFVPPVYHINMDQSKVRVSSSYIRSLIKKSEFELTSELLKNYYKIDLSFYKKKNINKNGYYFIDIKSINQVLPSEGEYKCYSKNNEIVHVIVNSKKLILSKDVSYIIFK